MTLNFSVARIADAEMTANGSLNRDDRIIDPGYNV
jgi:hypothetical protein